MSLSACSRFRIQYEVTADRATDNSSTDPLLSRPPLYESKNKAHHLHTVQCVLSKRKEYAHNPELLVIVIYEAASPVCAAWFIFTSARHLFVFLFLSVDIYFSRSLKVLTVQWWKIF